VLILIILFAVFYLKLSKIYIIVIFTIFIFIFFLFNYFSEYMANYKIGRYTLDKYFRAFSLPIISFIYSIISDPLLIIKSAELQFLFRNNIKKLGLILAGFSILFIVYIISFYNGNPNSYIFLKLTLLACALLLSLFCHILKMSFSGYDIINIYHLVIGSSLVEYFLNNSSKNKLSNKKQYSLFLYKK
jgi:hypothetical protein